MKAEMEKLLKNSRKKESVETTESELKNLQSDLKIAEKVIEDEKKQLQKSKK